MKRKIPHFPVNRFWLAVLLIIGRSLYCEAQNPERQQLPHRQPLPPEALTGLYPDACIGHFTVREDVQLDPEQFFTEHREWFGLGDGDELVLERIETDEAGIRHFRFRQHYRGIPLEHVTYLLHARQGRLLKGNGKIVHGLDFNTQGLLSPEAAVLSAIAATPARRYHWQDPDREASIQRKEQNAAASHYPKASLLLTLIQPTAGQRAENYVLAYRVPIQAVDPPITEYVYINPYDGTVIRREQAEMFCASGTALTSFNGTQTVFTTGGFPAFVSHDDCIDGELYSYDYNGGSYTLKSDVDNNWNSGSLITRMVMTSLWAARKTSDYYWSEFGLNGFDGSGDFIEIMNDYLFDGDCSGCNASWNKINDNMNIGTGASGITELDDFNTLDIVGHEFTHGVIEESSAIEYSGESGAINESFADIFGNLTEFYTEPGTPTDYDWQVGEDRRNADGDPTPIRNMANPNDHSDPDTYFGSHWYFDILDNSTYVHTNSGVGNYAFYLMAEGGSDRNDYGDTFHVAGLGIPVASHLAYNVMRYYLDSDPDYEDLREAYLSAAVLLYGSCSNVAIQVGNAWEAAGVGRFHSDYENSVCGVYGDLFIPENIDAIYSLRNRITLLGGGFGGLCNTTIASVSPVNFHSSSNITLEPGFHAQAGSVFHAYIDPCDVTDYRLPGTHYADESEFGNELLMATKALSWSVSPNPSDGPVRINGQVPGSGLVSIHFANALGQVFHQVEVPCTDGYFQTEYDAAEWPKGLLVVALHYNGEREIRKVILQ